MTTPDEKQLLVARQEICECFYSIEREVTRIERVASRIGLERSVELLGIHAFAAKLLNVIKDLRDRIDRGPDDD